MTSTTILHKFTYARVNRLFGPRLNSNNNKRGKEQKERKGKTKNNFKVSVMSQPWNSTSNYWAR